MSEAAQATEQPPLALPAPAAAPIVDLAGQPVIPKKAHTSKARWGGLTTPQARFCQLIAGGAKHNDSYRAAFSRPKMSRRLATIYASRLLAKQVVQDKVREYMEKSEAPTLLTINDRLHLLARFAHDPLVKTGDRIRAIAEYTTIAGENPPQSDHQAQGSVTVNVGVAVGGTGQPAQAQQYQPRATIQQRIEAIRAARARRYAPEVEGVLA